jgi:hypothetical protein
MVDRKRLDDVAREIEAARQRWEDTRRHPFGPGAFTVAHKRRPTGPARSPEEATDDRCDPPRRNRGLRDQSPSPTGHPGLSRA